MKRNHHFGQDDRPSSGKPLSSSPELEVAAIHLACQSLFHKKPRRQTLQKILGTLVLCGSLAISVPAFAAQGEKGEDGKNGTPGAVGVSVVDAQIKSADDIKGITWNSAGGAGNAGVPSNGDNGEDGPNKGGGGGGRNGDDGGLGGLGGKAGSGGDGGDVSATFDVKTSLNLGNIGGNGGAASIAGKGGFGGNGKEGANIDEPVTGDSPAGKGGLGGDGGNGGAGGDGGHGGSVDLLFKSGTVKFATGAQLGGHGGVGNAGGAGGNGGKGGAGGDGTLSFDAGNGGKGGDGGLGGDGGNGGNGGDAELTVKSGKVVFENASFGGNGGAGGAGGDGGAGGLGGDGGDVFPEGNRGQKGDDGGNGLLGIAGRGGNGGNAVLTIEGGIVQFSGTNNAFGGKGGSGGGFSGNDGCGFVTVSAGTIELMGNLTFNGDDSTMTLKEDATLNFSGSRTIDMGDGTFTFESGSALKREGDSGTLSIIAGSVLGPEAEGKIKLALTTSSEFLRLKASDISVYDTSFDLTGYRRDTKVETKEVGEFTVYSLKIDDESMDLEWKNKAGNGFWQAGDGHGGGNWSGGNDFYNADTALFKGSGRSTATLVGEISAAKIDVSAGSYTFAGNGYLSGDGSLVVRDGAALVLANSATNSFGGGVSVQNGASLTVTSASMVSGSVINIGAGSTLTLTAAENAANASIQQGKLNIDAGGTLVTNFVADTDMTVGTTKTVFVARDVLYENKGTATAESNRIFLVSELFWTGEGDERGDLCYEVTRVRSQFIGTDPQVDDVYDGYKGGNGFLDETLLTADDRDAALAAQSGFDMHQISGSGAILHSTANRVVDMIRFLPRVERSNRRCQEVSCSPVEACEPEPCAPRECLPCDKVIGIGGTTNLWVAPLYMNNRAFDMKSGAFRNGYVNDQYAFVFGGDLTAGRNRLGIAGYAGWGNTRSTGEVLRTWNDTAFGGVYGYYSVRGDIFDVKATVGWSGMESSLKQHNGSSTLKGKSVNGLTTIAVDFEKTFRLGRVRMTPMFGVQYGHYYQNGLDSTWDGEKVLRHGYASTDLVSFPIGVKLSSQKRWGSTILAPELRARYIMNVGDVNSFYKVRATGSDIPALMSSTLTDRHVCDLGVGLKAKRGYCDFGLDYDIVFSNRYQTQSVSAVFRFLY